MSINYFSDMVPYTPQFKLKNNQKASIDRAEICWMLYVPMWRHQQRRGDHAVTLTTDSFQIWVVQKYRDAFSKSSSIYLHRNRISQGTYLTYLASQDKFFMRAKWCFVTP